MSWHPWRRSKGYTRREAAFHPAQIEVEETPPAPAARSLLYLLSFLLVAFAVWASVAKLDINVEGSGKLRPDGETKPAQAAIGGKVSAVHVRSGQQVAEGALLLELDPAEALAERDRLTALRDAEILEAASAQLLLDTMEAGTHAIPRLAELAELADFDPALLDEAQLRLTHQLQELEADATRSRSQVNAVEAARSSQEAIGMRQLRLLQSLDKSASIQLESMRADIDDLNVVAAVRQEETKRSLGLLAAGAVSTVAVEKSQIAQQQAESRARQATDALALQIEEFERERQQLRDVADAADDRAAELAAESARINEEAAARRSGIARQAADSSTAALARRRAFDSELVKIEHLLERHLVFAAGSGTVEQLAVHVPGAIVQPGQELMRIVPDNVDLHAEVFVASKDLGHLRAGQEANLKLDAFPHTEHGLLRGTITAIATDAIEAEGQGLVFRVRIDIARQDMELRDGTIVPLLAGMGVTADVRTGERYVYEYFLDPLLQHRDKAFDER